MDKLISCGEFTACYNLIAFLSEKEKEYPIDESSERANLLDRLKRDWNEFQKNPQFLVDTRKSNFDL